MSNTKTVMSQAANTLTTPLNVEDVFSTYLYTGNGSTQTITNDIDLAGEGGLVWLKARSVGNWHGLYDTERGINKFLATNVTNAQISAANLLTSFNSDGFTIGATENSNFSGETATSWTFRKAPKFFDVVTYTGNGVAGRTVSHSLNGEVGCLIVKRTDTTGEWMVWHKDVAAIDPSYALQLQSTNAAAAYSTSFNSTAPTSTEFTLGNNSKTNNASGTYVAYLFAHNDGDGGFNGGDIIKCGSYTGNGQNALAGGNPVELGFEPQWVMIIPATLAGYGSTIFDSMRGMANGNSIIDPFLQANTSGSEASYGAYIGATPTGFIVENSGGYNNENGQTYIYIAIRRGTKVPESGTEVFAVDDRTGASGNLGAYRSGFPVDMAFHKVVTSSLNSYEIGSRLTQGKSMNTNDSSAEVTQGDQQYDYMDGWSNETSSSTTKYSWMWKRAPKFFDAVAYTGNGTAGRTVSHNLGVAPEMMWVKSRGNTGQWLVYNNNLNGGTSPEGYVLLINSTSAQIGPNAVYWNSTAPSSTDFTVGTNSNVNTSGNDYIAYLFASLDGVSKVGSYTGTGQAGGNINVDCGFTSGARFVMIKRTDASGTWWVADTERGIVTGNDPLLALNDTSAELTGYNMVEPSASGFIVNGSGVGGDNSWNDAGGNYIFYAIA